MHQRAHPRGDDPPPAGSLPAARPSEEQPLLLATAAGAARAAGALLASLPPGSPRVTARPDHDMKLDVDTMCEQAIVSAIRGSFPADSILAEEGGLLAASGGRTWVVDPLDGTVNYGHGLPLYCTSVACLSCRPDELSDRWSESLEVAAVLFPATGELYLAGRGAGATLNGEPLCLSADGTLAHALVCVGVRARDGDLPFCLRLVGSFAAEAQKVRSLGFAAGELAFLAAGRVDAVVVRGTSLWDFCAGALLVREAGGVVTASPVPPRGWLVTAARAGIHAEVSAIVGSK